jgi:predicted TIM-barrel fold metal-dependent hydrolase
MLCRFRPNIYLDVSGFQASLGYDPSASAVRNIVSLGINHKVLFGTDFPVFRLQGEQNDFVRALTAKNGPLSELNDREKSLFLYRNIERLLERPAVTVAA